MTQVVVGHEGVQAEIGPAGVTAPNSRPRSDGSGPVSPASFEQIWKCRRSTALVSTNRETLVTKPEENKYFGVVQPLARLTCSRRLHSTKHLAFETYSNMVPPWGTERQLAFLRSKRPLYRKHQAEGSIPFFWPDLFDEWFRLFPDRTWGNGRDYEDVSRLPSRLEEKKKY